MCYGSHMESTAGTAGSSQYRRDTCLCSSDALSHATNAGGGAAMPRNSARRGPPLLVCGPSSTTCERDARTPRFYFYFHQGERGAAFEAGGGGAGGAGGGRAHR